MDEKENNVNAMDAAVAGEAAGINEATSPIVKDVQLGDMVIYRTTEEDRKQISGNTSEFLPAIVVATWSPRCANLKVFTDGNPDLWVTSSSFGPEERQWQYPQN